MLAIILNHCGPVVQKAFQLYGRNCKSKECRKIMKRLKSQIKAFPTPQAIAVIEAETDIIVSENFPNFPLSPIAAGTIGQIYKVKDKRGKEVIIKVQRPELEEKAEQEFLLLRSLTDREQIHELLDHLHDALLHELDFSEELENFETMKIYDGKNSNRIRTVKLIHRYTSTKKVLFMEKALGAPLSDSTSSTKTTALEGLLYVWLQEGLFGSRDFHADLHEGNIFMLERDNDYVMTLIDYGSMGTMTIAEVKGFIKVALGTTYFKPDLIYRGLKPLAKWNEEQNTAVEKVIAEVLSETEKNPGQMTAQLFSELLLANIALTPNLVLFHRGLSFIEQQIEEAYIDDLGVKEGTKISDEAINQIYRRLFQWELFKDMLQTFDGKKNNSDCYVDKSLICSLVFGKS